MHAHLLLDILERLTILGVENQLVNLFFGLQNFCMNKVSFGQMILTENWH